MYKNKLFYYRQIFLYVFTLICFHQSLIASEFEYTFKQLSTIEGLSQGSVVDIEEDFEGNIWLATFNGLNRYDDIRIYPYLKNLPNFSIPHNEIVDLEIAPDGRLWALSNQSIFYRKATKI
ncbi:two-component regulator propeller domain-containing protein [Aliikangiella maris]|uniref:Two-component regulator propeller domain-containing protein n=2 Tax=Aliikangiella maris TaxID=3162458 RepID=A0ABV3MSX2_9GAMM